MFERLFARLLGRRSAEEVFEAKGFYFHEDDFCQQEVLPLACLEFCSTQLEEIDAFSAEHHVPGAGWSDIYVRDEPEQKLSDLGISRDELEAALGGLTRTDEVLSGYSSVAERCPRTCAFGFDGEAAIYADWSEEGSVEHIWTSIFGDDDQVEALVTALHKLGRKYPLLYVDWAWGFASPLDGSPKLAERLRQKLTDIDANRQG